MSKTQSARPSIRPRTEEPAQLRVSPSSHVRKVAGAMAHSMRAHNVVTARAVGTRAAGVMLNAAALASKLLGRGMVWEVSYAPTEKEKLAVVLTGRWK